MEREGWREKERERDFMNEEREKEGEMMGGRMVERKEVAERRGC